MTDTPSDAQQPPVRTEAGQTAANRDNARHADAPRAGAGKGPGTPKPAKTSANGPGQNRQSAQKTSGLGKPTPMPVSGPPFYLHVGVHKTGTTVLQKFLHDNQVALEQLGLHRLQTGLPQDNAHSWGNHDLAWTLRDQDSNGLWAQAAEEAAPYKAVVASSEEFSATRMPKRYAPVRAAITRFAIRPICYLRRQDQLLESTYNYHVKSLGETKPIMEFAERILKRLEFDTVLGALARNFGDKALIVRIYDPEHLKGDIFDDFLDAVGLPGAGDQLVKPQATLNAGLSGEGLARMLDANRTYQDNPDRLKEVRRDILETYAAPTWNEHEILTAAERRALMRQFRPGNNRVARRFFDRPALF